MPFMTRRTTAHPDFTDSRVQAPFFSTWRVGTPLRQRQTVEAIAETWERRPWPADGLLGYYLYTGHDSSTLLHHSRWADEQAYEAYRYYRSHGPVDRAGRAPGCIVIVDIEFDGPDPERQRAWVDAVVEALESEPNPHPGGIRAHFHLSTDGTRVLNYAEWESAQAHLEALAASGDGIGSGTAQWGRVQTWPGLKSGSVSRYDYALGLLPD
jgi:heme-degrading monooxygenase HmoA